jgi:hypothetical protein
MPFLVQRAGDGTDTTGDERYQWVPIRAPLPSTPRHSYHNSSQARLSRPPNLPCGFVSPRTNSPAISPAQGYSSEVQPWHSAAREGLSNTIPPATTNLNLNLDRPQPAPLTRRNLETLEAVRHGQVAHNAQLKSRISTVSQYPVLVNRGGTGTAPSIDSRRVPSRRRPISVASTSTTGIYLAVAQLPGSIPFQLQPPTEHEHEHVISAQRQGTPPATLQSVHSSNSVYHHRTSSVYQTAQAVRVLARTTPNASTTSLNRINNNNNRASVISVVSQVDITPPRNPSLRSIPTRLESSPRRTIKPSATWPINRQSGDGAYSRRSGRGGGGGIITWNNGDISPRPPPPPPKDDGYIGRPAAHGQRLRVYSSTPHLPTYLAHQAAMDREDTTTTITPEVNKDEKKQPSPSSPRRWFGGLAKMKSRPRLLQRMQSPVSEMALAPPPPPPMTTTTSQDTMMPSSAKPAANRRSQLLVACARLIGRAVPNMAVHRGSL